MSDEKRSLFLADRSHRILAAILLEDPFAASELLNEVVETYDAPGIYAVCCVMAESIYRSMFADLPRGDGSLQGEYLMKVETSPGVEEDPESMWAARFACTYINGDMKTNSDLYFGTMDDIERHTGGVCALITLARDAIRAGA